MFSKSAQRVSASISRASKRFYTTDGATASSGSFGKKEKAVENQWARTHVSKQYERVFICDNCILIAIFTLIGC